MGNLFKTLISNNSFTLFSLKAKNIFAEIIFELPLWINEVNEMFGFEWEEAKENGLSVSPESQKNRLKRKFINWLDQNSDKHFIGTEIEDEARQYFETTEDKITQEANYLYGSLEKYGYIQIIDYMEYKAISMTDSGLNLIIQLEKLNQTIKTSYQSQWGNVKDSIEKLDKKIKDKYLDDNIEVSFTDIENIKDFVKAFTSNLKSIQIKMQERISTVVKTSFYDEKNLKLGNDDEIDNWIKEVEDFIDTWFDPAFYQLNKECSKNEINRYLEIIKKALNTLYSHKKYGNIKMIEWNDLVEILANDMCRSNVLSENIEMETAINTIENWKKEIVGGLSDASHLIDNIVKVCLSYQRLIIQKINFLLSNEGLSKEAKMKEILNKWINNGLTIELKYNQFKPINSNNITYPRKNVELIPTVIKKHLPVKINKTDFDDIQKQFREVSLSEKKQVINFIEKIMSNKIEVKISDISFDNIIDTGYYLTIFILSSDETFPFEISIMKDNKPIISYIENNKIVFEKDYLIRRKI